MNNLYYHDFTIGLNAWYFVIPIELMIFFVLGTTRFSLNRDNLKIRRRGWKYGLQMMVAKIIATAFSIYLMVKESGLGALQFMINGLSAEDDPFWALTSTAVAFVVATVVLFALFGGALTIGERVMLKHLKRKKREAKIVDIADYISKREERVQ